MLLTTISSFSSVSPHSAIGPMSLTKPSIGSTTSASISRVVFAFTSRSIDVREASSGSACTCTSCSSWNVNSVRAPRRDRRLELRDRRAVRAESVAAMHERHVRRAIEELRAPIERRVAAADDHDALAAERLRVGDDVVDRRARTTARRTPAAAAAARTRRCPRR